METPLWVWLVIKLMSIIPIIKNISSNMEQKTSFVCYQTCYTCSALHSTIYMNPQLLVDIACKIFNFIGQ